MKAWVKYYILRFIQIVNPCTRYEGEPDRLIFKFMQLLVYGVNGCTCCAFLRGVVIGAVIAWFLK